MLRAYTRPRCQVNVYRTIGPLVSAYTISDGLIGVTLILFQSKNELK